MRIFAATSVTALLLLAGCESGTGINIGRDGSVDVKSGGDRIRVDGNDAGISRDGSGVDTRGNTRIRAKDGTTVDTRSDGSVGIDTDDVDVRVD